MLLIDCPFCGERDEREFRYGGEAYRPRPADPGALDDQEWADYLFVRSDIKGIHHERWHHTFGCGLWFVVARHTVTHEIKSVRLMSPHTPEDPR